MHSTPFKKGLMFLLNFAWKTRLKLPYLLLIAALLLDIRLSLEVSIGPGADHDGLVEISVADEDEEADDENEGNDYELQQIA